MDYLHGDIADGEFEAARDYEYSRESAVLREAARLLVGNMCSEEISFHCGDWFIQNEWSAIWECRSFPAKSWNQLKPSERAEIIKMGLFPLPPGTIAPLKMNETWRLDAMGIFDEFKGMAEQVKVQRRENFGNPKPIPKSLPIIEGWPKQKMDKAPWVHALFTLDFRKTPERLKDEFCAWLRLPENEARFGAYKHPPQRSDSFKDQLKALAGWRLYTAKGNDWLAAREFAEDNRKRFTRSQKIGGISYKAGDTRPFHNPGRKKGKGTPLNREPLFSDQPACLKSIRNAKGYLAERIPWEFGKIAKEREQGQREWVAKFAAALKQARQTSTKSS